MDQIGERENMPRSVLSLLSGSDLSPSDLFYFLFGGAWLLQGWVGVVVAVVV